MPRSPQKRKHLFVPVRSVPRITSALSGIIVPSWALGPCGCPTRWAARRSCSRISLRTRSLQVRIPLSCRRAHTLRQPSPWKGLSARTVRICPTICSSVQGPSGPRVPATGRSSSGLLRRLRCSYTVVLARFHTRQTPWMPYSRPPEGEGEWFILAVVISQEIGDIGRFHGPERPACHAGTVPRVHASIGKMRYGRLRPDGFATARRTHASTLSLNELPAETILSKGVWPRLYVCKFTNHENSPSRDTRGRS
jgi:hypothetical protein